MSDELRLGITLFFSKGNASIKKSEHIEVDVAGDAFTNQVQSIAVTPEAALVEGAAIGTPGYVYVKNLDSTNYVHVGITGSYTIKLLAGQFALFPAAAAIFAIAPAGICLVEYCIIEL